MTRFNTSGILLEHYPLVRVGRVARASRHEPLTGRQSGLAGPAAAVITGRTHEYGPQTLARPVKTDCLHEYGDYTARDYRTYA